MAFLLMESGDGFIPLFGSFPDEWIAIGGVGSPTYDDLQDYINTTGDSGKLSGGSASDDGDGTITMSAMTGLIYTTDSPVGSLVFFDLAQDTTLTLTDEALNYIYAQYNGGTPRYQATTAETDISGTDEFVVALVWKSGTDIHIANVGKHIANFPQDVYRHAFYVEGLVRANGCVLTDATSLQVNLSAGNLSWSLHLLSISAATPKSFKLFYNDGAWQEGSLISTLPNTQYNNYGTGLADLTAQRYGIYWMYLVTDGDMYGVYGVGDYTLAQAVLAQPPANLPPELASIGVLIAKVVFQKSAAEIHKILYPWTETFAGSGAGDHGNLAGLTDDDHTQYLLADGTRALTGQWNMGAQLVGINETANAKMTVGLTINQGANNDECLALKASAVNHGITDSFENDTFGIIMKNDPTHGGIFVAGVGSERLGVSMAGYVTTEDTTILTTPGYATIRLLGRLKSGTGAGVLGATGSLVTMVNHTTPVWECKGDGDTYQSGNITVQNTAPAIKFIDTNAADSADFCWIGKGADTFYIQAYDDSGTAYKNLLTLNAILGTIDVPNSIIILDEDAMGSNSAEHLATQQSIKAYVDTEAAKCVLIDGTRALTGNWNIGVSRIIFINDTANTKMNRGITIKQATSTTDELISLKHTDIAHGMTTWAETDTVAVLRVKSAVYGACQLTGYSTDVIGLHLVGRATNEDTAYAVGNYGAVLVSGAKKTGTTTTSIGDTGNVFKVKNYTATKFVVKGDGDIVIGEDIRTIAGNGVTLSENPMVLGASITAAQDNLDINTWHTVNYTEYIDVGSDYTSPTFTAPISGYYLCHAMVTLTDWASDASYYYFIIGTSNRNYFEFKWGDEWADDKDYITLQITAICDMDAADTLTCSIYQTGGTKQTDILADANLTRLHIRLLG